MSETTNKIKSAMVRARMEPGLKTKAEKYFDLLGNYLTYTRRFQKQIFANMNMS
jgi:hypothetical protein